MSQNKSNFVPQSAGHIARNKALKKAKHLKRMTIQGNKVLSVARGTTRKLRGNIPLEAPVAFDTTSMAHAFRNLKVMNTAYTTAGTAIGAHIASAIRRGVGVSAFKTNNYKLSFRTAQTLKQQGVLTSA